MISNALLSPRLLRWTLLMPLVSAIQLDCIPARGQEKKLAVVKPSAPSDARAPVIAKSSNVRRERDDELLVGDNAEQLFLAGIAVQGNADDSKRVPTAMLQDRVENKTFQLKKGTAFRVGQQVATIVEIEKHTVLLRVQEKLRTWKLGAALANALLEEAEHSPEQATKDSVGRFKVQLELLEDSESLIIRGEKEDVKRIGDLLGQLGRDRLEPTRGAVSEQTRAEELAADVSQAKALSRTCQHVAQAIVPSVVKVARAKEDDSSGDRRSDSPAGVVPFGRSLGAGVIIEHSAPAKSAIILTSYSNVRDATEVTVTTSDGREFEGVDVKGDAATDVAIVRISGIEKAKAAPFGDSDELELGQLILAVGHPFGLAGSVSMGVVSGKERQLGGIERATMIQTDAAANAGSAGGPLVNLDGKVVAMVSAIASRSGGFDGVAFAVPINHARLIAQKLIQHDRVPRGRLGVAIKDLTPALRTKLNAPLVGGVLVGEVLEESPAANAGIQSGDIIVEFAGSKVSRPIDLQMTVDRTPIDTKQELKLIRDGKEMSVSVVLKELRR